MADETSNQEPTLVEQWLEEQREWQKTTLAYIDSIVRNEEFLTHLGNAMRGSLLAGKPYPTPVPPSASAPESDFGDRLDQLLFAVRELQGQVADLRMTLDEIRAARDGAGTDADPATGASDEGGGSKPAPPADRAQRPDRTQQADR